MPRLDGADFEHAFEEAPDAMIQQVSVSLEKPKEKRLDQLIYRNYSEPPKMSSLGSNRIVLDEFKIKKTVDIKRLKHQLWGSMAEKLQSEEQKQDLTLSRVMDDLYHNKKAIKPHNVSV